jgi:hypothetical protein
MNEDKIVEINTLVRKNSRTELVRMCKEKNLSCSGTKHDMAVRLMGGLSKHTSAEPSVRKIIIRRNARGLWQYEDLVFDDKTKNVVGRIGADGITILPLQRADIEKCRQYKFHYVLPDLLDDRPDAVKAHAISDDEEEDDDDDEEDGQEED